MAIEIESASDSLESQLNQTDSEYLRSAYEAAAGEFDEKASCYSHMG